MHSGSKCGKADQEGRPYGVKPLVETETGLLFVSEDVIDSLLDRGDLFGLVVGNFALEFLFQRHDQLNGVQGIRAQIVYEGGLILDVRLIYTQLFGDDLLDALYDVIH
jgi:hypothetical protein